MKKNKFIGSIFSLVIILSALKAYGGGKERHGDFEFANARKLLEISIKELSTEILIANDSCFPRWPSQWNKEKLSNLIKSIRFEYDRETTGINPHDQNEKRIFDYGQEGDGFYLSALKPFFENYAHIPSDLELPWVKNIIRDIKTKMLHEASHIIWNFNEYEADFYSQIMILRLENYQLNEKKAILKTLLQFLRQQFVRAHPPSRKELRLDQKWTCWQYDVETESIVVNKEMVFSEISDFLMNLSKDLAQNFVYSPLHHAFIGTKIDTKNIGLSRTIRTHYLRATPDGSLIVEMAKKTMKEGVAVSFEGMASSADISQKLEGYSICN